MGGSNNLYISEMLDNFQANMEKSMGDLAASMEGMAESMAASTAAMAEIVKNTSQSVSELKVAASQIVQSQNDKEITFSCSARNGNGTAITKKIGKFLCSGTVRIKLNTVLKSNGGDSSWTNLVNTASSLKVGGKVIANSSYTGFSVDHVVTVNNGDEVELVAQLYTGMDKTITWSFGIDPGALQFCYDIQNILSDGAFAYS